jgi:hypothetical protein
VRRLGIYISLVIIYLSGLIVLLDFFTDGIPIVDGGGRVLALWVSIITGFLLLLGLGNIVRVHIERIRQRHENAVYSAALLLSAFGVILAGLIGRVLLPDTPNAVNDWVFRYIYQPLAVTLFSLLAFLTIGAAVRALRLSSIEATLLVVGAVLVLIGQIAIAPLDSAVAVSQWFQDYPVLGIVRGILIGASLGAIATSLRYLLGVDNQYLR